ncbi:hypothetical protein [Haladaptatus sp. NG-SE-30]
MLDTTATGQYKSVQFSRSQYMERRRIHKPDDRRQDRLGTEPPDETT